MCNQSQGFYGSTNTLSPTAQAVLDAVEDHGEFRYRDLAAAALRAAVELVIASVSPPCEDSDEYAQGFLAAHIKYREELLAIAAELENNG